MTDELNPVGILPPDILPKPPEKSEVLKAIVKEVLDCNNPDEVSHQTHVLHHPVYGTGYKCSDVVAMEKTDGRHNKSCAHVGFIAAKKCGCNG